MASVTGIGQKLIASRDDDQVLDLEEATRIINELVDRPVTSKDLEEAEKFLKFAELELENAKDLEAPVRARYYRQPRVPHYENLVWSDLPGRTQNRAPAVVEMTFNAFQFIFWCVAEVGTLTAYDSGLQSYTNEQEAVLEKLQPLVERLERAKTTVNSATLVLEAVKVSLGD